MVWDDAEDDDAVRCAFPRRPPRDDVSITNEVSLLFIHRLDATDCAWQAQRYSTLWQRRRQDSEKHHVLFRVMFAHFS